MSVQDIVERRGNSRENLLVILHDLQQGHQDNSLHQDDLDELARVMGLNVADIVSTASFYTMFSLVPRGRHLIRLCESPPCYIMGEEDIRKAIQDKLGIDFGQTTQDGCFTLEASSCLGSCGVAPVMMVDDELYGNLTRQKTGDILDRIAAADRQSAIRPAREA